MIEKDAAQLQLLQDYLSEQAHIDRQREKNLPPEVQGWLRSGDSALGNDPDLE
jgi:hypothetical protein